MKRALLAIALVAACGRDSARPPPTTLPVLVAGPARDWSVSVDTVHAPSSAVAAAVPMLAMRAFEPEEPLEGYGLDPPAAIVTFTHSDGADNVELRVGAENFDGTAYYVQPAGDERIYLVPDDQLDPLLSAAR